MSQLPPGIQDDDSDDQALLEATHGDAPCRENGRRRQGLGRWLLILLGGILGYLGALYYLSKVPQQYTATVTFLLKPPADDGRIGSSFPPESPPIWERSRSRDLLDRVACRKDVRDLKGIERETTIDWRPEWLGGGTRIPSSPPSAVPAPDILAGRISQWLKVSIRRGTRLIDVSITHPEPDTARMLADAITRECLADDEQSRESSIVEERSFARTPGVPSGPVRTQTLTLGTLSGLLLAMLLVMLRALQPAGPRRN